MRCIALGIISILVLAGCGGGSGSARVAPPVTSASPNGKVVLSIPKRPATSSARRPKYISASTSSISVSVNGKAPTIADVGEDNPMCGNSEDSTTCTIPLTAPAGHDTFTFTEYAGTAGTGTVLGGGTIPFTVVAGQPFVLNATLDGVVGSLQLDLGTLPMSGTAGTTTLTVTAFDPAGETIVGPGNYTSPITLTVTDPTHQTTLSTSTITGPSTTPVTVSYAGGANVSATITATTNGATPVSVVFTPISSGGPVYYVGTAYDTIVGFPLNANGGGVTPSRVVGGDATGLSYPYGLAVDASHDLYATNSTATPPSITEYAPMPNGNVAPIRTISGSLTQLSGAGSIAVDAGGNMYVADCGLCFPVNGMPAILTFAADAVGNSSPMRVIQGGNTGLSYVYSIAIDNANNLMVPLFYSQVVEFFPETANGNVAPSGTLGGNNTGIQNPACAITDASGKIYVCNFDEATINVFAAGSRGNVAPLYTIGGPNTGMGEPRMIAFDANGYMYVTQASTDQVFVFAPGFMGDHAPTYMINPGSSILADPVGIVVSP